MAGVTLSVVLHRGRVDVVKGVTAGLNDDLQKE
jgi:hypothetical protein